MATDDLDPVQSQRRANDQLRVAMLQLDEHIQALTAPTMELALIQKKRAAESGLEAVEPSSLLQKFISQAVPLGGHLGVAAPGQTGPDASNAMRGSAPIGSMAAEGAIYNEMFGAEPGRAGAPMPWAKEPSPIRGKTNIEAQRLEEEPVRIPSFGDWRMDALLKLGSQWAGKKALSNYETYASQAGEEAASPQEWLSQQGPLAAGNVSGGFASGAEHIAQLSAIHAKVLKPVLDIGFGAAHMGASLGYTPQGGGTLGASHILGIPNPLSVIGPWASAAARQGTGTFVNAAEQAFGGTGIGFSEANQLREGLAAQGWSNQRSGGFLGATVGGMQETLAQNFEPLVKMGFNPEQLASTTNALKLGQATPEELKKTLEQLPEAAKVLHKTLEEVTAGMEEFAAKAVIGGTSQIHGMRSYNEIWKNTGLNPLLTQAANEGTFGKVQAAQKGVLPWQIASMTGNQASTNAYAAVKQLSEIAGPGTAVKTTNKYGETEEISAKDAKLAMMHQLEPNMTTEYMQRMLEVGPHMEAAASGMHKADQLQAFISQKQHENQAYGPHVHEAVQSEHEWHREAAWQKQIEENLKKNPGDAAEEINLETAKANAQAKYHAMIAAKGKAAGEGHLNAQQEGNVIEQLAGKGGLYQRAREAGLEQHGELKQWMTMDPAKQVTAINAALAKVAEVKPEKEGEEKAKIELTEEAKKWFRLQFPNAKAPKEIAGEGGKSTASQAAQPNTGESAANASLMRQYQQSRRNEPTAGG